LPAIAGRAPPNGANPANRSVTNEVSPAFFRTLGVPLLAGRVFTETDDANGPGVAIVNETFVRQFELGAAALGTRFDLGERARDIEIVGVVQDAKYSTVKGETPAQLFLPYRGDLNLDALTFYVRGTLDEGSLLALVPRVVAEIAPNVPVTNLLTLERQVQDNVFLDRIVTMLSSSLAVLATLLAAVGLYGALAYNVARRTRELGLRLAMGARPRDLRRMILRQVGRMALVGGAIGLVAAIAAGRAAESLLFGLSGYDAGVLSGAAIVLALIVLGAGYWPARQAARVEPMEALRYE
jgi:ABC-type antimicrobial peptide transport system permease subunit